MDLLLDHPILISQDHSNIDFFKTIVKEQCVDICVNEKDKQYVLDCLKQFDYGYIILTKENIFILKGFVLFRYEELGSTLINKILCGLTKYENISLKLIECVLEFIAERRIETWIIYSLNNPKLIEFYEKIGFKIIKTICKDHIKNVYQMQREFTYNEIVFQFHFEDN